MLTRFYVNGFKNLYDLTVHFGPFTCIAGPNGAGKSNLLDAIQFMGALADKSFQEAALAVRDDKGRQSGDVRGVFRRVGDDHETVLTLGADLIIPPEVTDDFGQPAQATSTFVTYDIKLRFRGPTHPSGPIELVHEELRHIPKGAAKSQILFPCSPEWFQKTVRNERRTSHFISTTTDGRVLIHQDGGSRGQPQKLLAEKLPRTGLSGANALESPTLTAVRRELQSWRHLQLEPSALREPDPFLAPTILANNGAHLAAVIARLESVRGSSSGTGLAQRLSDLLDGIREVGVDRDEKRELLTAYLIASDGTPHQARALSDGTLRFLALTALSEDERHDSLLYLEEPENGIHPQRIPAMVKLLQSLSTNTSEWQDPEDGPPRRQVIINTHSPELIREIPADDLLVASSVQTMTPRGYFGAMRLTPLDRTWRTKLSGKSTTIGDVLTQLGKSIESEPVSDDPVTNGTRPGARRKIRDVEKEYQRRLFPDEA